MNLRSARPWLTPVMLGLAMVAQLVTAWALNGALDRERQALERADRALDFADGYRTMADEWRRLSLEIAADRCGRDIGLRGPL